MSKASKWLHRAFSAAWILRVFIAVYAIVITIAHDGQRVFVGHVGYTMVYFFIPLTFVYLIFLLLDRGAHRSVPRYSLVLFLVGWALDIGCVVMARTLIAQ